MSADKRGFFRRLSDGLKKSSSRLTGGLADVFTKGPLGEAELDAFEEALIAADLGVALSADLRNLLRKSRFGTETSHEDAEEFLRNALRNVLQSHEAPLAIDRTKRPFVIMAVGVNGAGKTTTLGKLALRFRDQGLKVTLAAGDTFRAAAIEQLKIWGERTGAEVVARDIGADAAALAYEAHERACETGADVLLLDTAGRLQNKRALMEELRKIVRVLQKRDESAPHETLLVLDGTAGGNAVVQAEAFLEAAPVTGLAVTKLDGTAKGGAVVAAAKATNLPVRLIGVGEDPEDLQDFSADAFARSLIASDARAEA